MKKNNVRIKEEITLTDKINAINALVDSVFTEDAILGNYGYMNYTPYFYDMGLVIAIAENFLDGIEFEENDRIYDCITSDSEIVDYIENYKLTIDCAHIITEADKIIEHKKNEIISINTAIYSNLLNSNNKIETKLEEILDKESKRLDAETKVLKEAKLLAEAQLEQTEYMNKVNKEFTPEETAEMTRKMAETDFDPNNIASIFIDKYANSDIHKANQKSIVDFKKKKSTSKSNTSKGN